MSYTMGQAARATGKSKATILRAIRSGKISAEKSLNGVWRIEPAEVYRVIRRFHQTPVQKRTIARLEIPSYSLKRYCWKKGLHRCRRITRTLRPRLGAWRRKSTISARIVTPGAPWRHRNASLGAACSAAARWSEECAGQMSNNLKGLNEASWRGVSNECGRRGGRRQVGRAGFASW